MINRNSKEMEEFIDKVDSLCHEYGYEIIPTPAHFNVPETITILGKGEHAILLYIDGDGGGK